MIFITNEDDEGHLLENPWGELLRNARMRAPPRLEPLSHASRGAHGGVPRFGLYLAPGGEETEEAEAARRRSEACGATPVSPAQRSRKAFAKARAEHTDDGITVHSFQTLLEDLVTVAKNRVRTKAGCDTTFDVITTPTPIQQRAFDLLGVSHGM